MDQTQSNLVDCNHAIGLNNTMELSQKIDQSNSIAHLNILTGHNQVWLVQLGSIRFDLKMDDCLTGLN